VQDGRDSSAGINIRGAHSWDEVIRAARDAESQYLAEAKRGVDGNIRRFFRTMGNHAPSVTPWLQLLPDDKYFSVLCGGLKLILGVSLSMETHYLATLC